MKYFLTQLALFAIATQFHSAAGIAVAGSTVDATDDTLDTTSSTTDISSSGSTTATSTPMVHGDMGDSSSTSFNASLHANMTADTASPTDTASAGDPYKDKDVSNDTPPSNSTNGLSDCDSCMCLNQNFYEMHLNQDGQNQNHNQDGQGQEPGNSDLGKRIEGRMMLHGCDDICDNSIVQEAKNGEYGFNSHCANYVNPYTAHGGPMEGVVKEGH